MKRYVLVEVEGPREAPDLDGCHWHIGDVAATVGLYSWMHEGAVDNMGDIWQSRILDIKTNKPQEWWDE